MFSKEHVWALILCLLEAFIKFFQVETSEPLPAAQVGEAPRGRVRAILGVLKMGSKEWGFVLAFLRFILNFFQAQPETETEMQPAATEEASENIQVRCLALIDSALEEDEETESTDQGEGEG